MVEVVKQSRFCEVDAFVLRHPRGHFMQTSMWGLQKPDWTQVMLAKCSDDGEIRGSLALLIRRVPRLPYTMMYASRGPVCDADDEETMLDLLNAARKLARSFRSYVIKADPPLPSGSAAIESAFRTLKFLPPPDTKNFESIQPRYVFRLDIDGKTPDEIFASFASKTRYNVRVAERKGVAVYAYEQGGERPVYAQNGDIAAAPDLDTALDAFAALMAETGERDGFTTRERGYFENMLRNLDGHCRLYLCTLPDGTPVSGAICINCAKTTWYLYGASSSEHRDYMPNYLMQWAMIGWAVERGSAIYDFRGVSGDLSEDNPLYGLYKFKKGFGGELCEFTGEWEYRVSPLVCWLAERGKRAMIRRARRGK